MALKRGAAKTLFSQLSFSSRLEEKEDVQSCASESAASAPSVDYCVCDKCIIEHLDVQKDEGLY